VLVALAAGCIGGTLAAQDLSGTWQGTLDASRPQRIVVKIAEEGTVRHGVVYNLDADMAYEGRATTEMSLEGMELRFAIAPIEASYVGKMSADGGSFAGMWTQGRQTHALTLARANGDAAWEIPKEDAAMAKDADPDFEVVTVKPSDPSDQNRGFHLGGRRIFVERKTVEKMLMFAYVMQAKQIVGEQDWMKTDLWDVKGIPDVPGQPSLKQFQSLVRKVLAERFGLKTHTETRELAVYAITQAKGGEKIAKSAGDPNGLPDEEDGESDGQTTMRMTNSTMGDFVIDLMFYMDRPVVDETGLAGRFDFQLKWTYDETRAPTGGSAAPSLFTAVQEQLGLKLDAVKAATDVMVIDHVERPSAN
jgi:uncharacterized protein (TIGR03435 family)